jgi:hypothetical protein
MSDQSLTALGANVTRRMTRTKQAVLRLAAVVLLAMAAGAARADTWRGTAPFCDGSCLPGETQIATSSCGDGACCWTGNKVLCRNAQPTCAALQTRTACYGVVLVCDNGHYVGGNDPSWVSCSKYACGVCFGFSW